jgi:hypothetical protein
MVVTRTSVSSCSNETPDDSIGRPEVGIPDWLMADLVDAQSEMPCLNQVGRVISVIRKGRGRPLDPLCFDVRDFVARPRSQDA